MFELNQLYEALSTPSHAVIEDLAAIDGDITVLGVGGKLGPEMAIMARRALDKAGSAARVIGVARSLDAETEERLKHAGVTLVQADLLDDDALDALPEATGVVYLAGRKFGTSGQEAATWLVNTYLPGRVAQRYAGSHIVALSTGNVYPLVPVHSGGATEQTPPAPIGEYAASSLGRERVMSALCERTDTPLALLRLNYAVELRYGILLEVAQAVHDGVELDVTTGVVNVIWQGDVNTAALRALRLTDVPALTLNITGPETVSIRWLAHRFGGLFGREPRLVGEEAPTALLSNASAYHRLLGYPQITLEEAIEWTATWIGADGPTHGKPTHFSTRDGNF
jgi:nucleoside-diphosphate-sugar epimerase